ncbi:hypothetical protein HPB49_021554 [Dermacentor silvarum]|uniref:Uncharacterized protein n=1 Tax=Dermacentor silvarum TaxID=543639 RepID=A0ACB8CSW0_DERSI|nr:hypothetical protein HPB49_021554 [Dermacentor silvarum]
MCLGHGESFTFAVYSRYRLNELAVMEVRDKMTFTMISATITLFLILLILGLVLYVAQEQADVSTTDPDFMLTRAEVTKGQTSTKDATTKQASRPAPSTKKRTPPPTKKAPETLPTEAPKALGIETLLCIYGERTTSDAVMARDGLCHYAFYDSLYARARNNLSSGQPFEKDLQTFMRVAAKYNKTTSGVAFAFDKLRFHPDLLIVLGHYQFGDNTVKNCAVMPPTRHPDDDPPDNVAKAYSYDLSNGPFSLREFYATNGVSRGLLSVTMKGRWTEPKTSDAMDFFSPCLYDPSSESFGSYTEVALLDKALVTSSGGRPVLIAKGLAARHFVMQVCKHTRYAAELNYSASHYAMLAHQATGGRAFAYDNERGLCDKICRVKREVDDVYFGIAAYDIDYDDYGNYCASLNMYGPHSRLKALRKIVDYFRGLVGGQFDERACTSVVT